MMRLGLTTDTQDCTGRTVRRGEWRGIAPAAVTGVAHGFLGRGTQIPPMYSALKRDGVPLYKLARKGEEVPREPREIEIHALEIERIDLPDVAFVVRCSRGVYVRTLANDMGERLGCGAHLVELRRTMSGPFAIEQAVSLEKLAADAGEGRLASHLISCFAALAHLPQLSLTDQGALLVSRGISPETGDFQEASAEQIGPGERLRLCRDGRLLAVAENGAAPWPGEASRLRLLRVFNEH